MPNIHIPVQGVWKLIKSPGHDRFAFDLVAVDDDSHRTSRKSRLQHIMGHANAGDSYSWSRPVYAPIESGVVHPSEGNPDQQRLALVRDLFGMIFSSPKLNSGDIRRFAGNYVIIHGDNFHVSLAHMQCESLQVTEGDEVEVGQFIARVGNSGFTPDLIFIFSSLIGLITSSLQPRPRFVSSHMSNGRGNVGNP